VSHYFYFSGDKFTARFSYPSSQDTRLFYRNMDKVQKDNLAVYKWIIAILSIAALIQLIIALL